MQVNDKDESPTERWQRRERKLKARKERMKVSGAGLKKVVLPVIQRKAEEAERKAKGRRDNRI